MREKLIDILSVPIYPHELADPAEVVADHLLDNDVVPVVRCKDCRYCQKDAFGLWCFNDYEHDLQPDDFCSYGERRTE